MELSTVASYVLFFMKLRLRQLFCSKKGGTGGTVNMISHSDWRRTTGSLVGGVAHELESKLGKIVNMFETTIRHSYSSSDPVQTVWLNLSLQYLRTSYFFVQRLWKYIVEQFRILCYGTGEDDAWEVVMKAVRSIFEDYFASVRNIPLSEFPKGSGDELGKRRFYAKLIWNSLQTMELTKQMLAKDIRHHHTISSAYTEWSLINSGKTEAKKAMAAMKPQ